MEAPAATATPLPPAANSGTARVARWIILFLLLAAPLALGSVHEPAFVPLLVLASVAGLLSWWPPGWRSGLPASAPPGVRLWLAFLALIVFHVVPLPQPLLALLSPGTHAFHERLSLVPVTAWRPISVNPADTGRGLAFAVAFLLLYAAAERESAHRHWRRQVIWTVVGTAFLATVVALIQAQTATPGKIYGLWRPLDDFAVFGPYVNRNHFANYLVMAAPLSLALLIEAISDLSQTRRVRRWLALGDPPAARALLCAVVSLTLLVGLFSTRSRGGVAASLLALALLAIVLGRRRGAIVALALLLAATVLFVDPAPFLDSLRGRPFAQDRWPFWKDALRAVPHFPLFGAGFNAYGTLSPHYQTGWQQYWVPQAHNEYLQVLIDTGLLGVALVGGLLALLARAAFRAARHTTLGAGLFAALGACAMHNVLEFGWQIPANAATFVVLAGLAVRQGHLRRATSAPDSLDAARTTDLEFFVSSGTRALR